MFLLTQVWRADVRAALLVRRRGSIWSTERFGGTAGKQGGGKPRSDGAGVPPRQSQARCNYVFGI